MNDLVALVDQGLNLAEILSLLPGGIPLPMASRIFHDPGRMQVPMSWLFCCFGI